MREPTSSSLLLDIYGAFVRDLGGWIAVADLVDLLEDLGVEEQLVRSSVSRFSRKGLLERSKVDGRIGYGLSETSRRNIAANDARVFSRLERARLEEGWVLVTFSIPEEIRAERHNLRTRLTWLGFGSLGGGLWIAPARMLERARARIEALGLQAYVDIFEAHYRAFDDPKTLVARCWDLDAMRTAYVGYVQEFGPLLDEEQDVDAREAFRRYVAALHAWRTLPHDPGLPAELLPEGWEGSEAAELFMAIRDRLEPAAKRHVMRTVSAPAVAS